MVIPTQQNSYRYKFVFIKASLFPRRKNIRPIYKWTEWVENNKQNDRYSDNFITDNFHWVSAVYCAWSLLTPAPKLNEVAEMLNRENVAVYCSIRARKKCQNQIIN